MLNLVPISFVVYPAIAGSTHPQLLKAALDAVQGFAVVGWLSIGFIADVFAIGWFGMRLALTAKNPKLAPPLTILCVLVLPSIAICGLDMVADLFFILWAATSLHTDLRWLLAREHRPVRKHLPTNLTKARPVGFA